MSKDVQITHSGSAGKPLGKEQKRFNTLVQKIALLREQIELVKTLDIELRNIGTNRIKPVELKAMAATRDWVFALHQQSEKEKLSHKLAKKFPDIMVSEMEPLMAVPEYREDAELTALYAFYEGSGRSYEEIAQEEADMMKEMATMMMNDMYGLDLEPEDLDNPAAAFEKMEAKKAEQEAAERERAEKKSKKPKTESQQKAEEKRLAAEQAVKKTARQMYLDLVRHFHPDKEPDEVKRAEKTEVMKQITAAFDADDHLKLIELQMSLLSGRDNIVSGFDDAQLKFFNKTLHQQVQELESELHFESPAGNGNPFGVLFSMNKSTMLRNVEMHIQQQKKLEQSLQHNTRLLKMPKMFKDFVRDYELDDMDDYMFDMF
jgi:hypothetical protein